MREPLIIFFQNGIEDRILVNPRECVVKPE
jgi:hypothetical protein